MAQTLTILIFIFFNFSTSNGFSLKLTHRDSPHSPLFNPNLSDFERFTKNINISKTRASHFKNWSETKSESLILPLTHHELLFTVELALGTPLVKRTFIFDTGSDLTWTQCKPCVRCFKQNEPLFDFRKSKSYKKLTRNDNPSKTFMCNRLGCVYHVQYYSGQMSSGIALSENFYFRTAKGNYRNALRLAFGCGIHNKGSLSKANVVSGIFGLNKEPASFARQLSSSIKDRFSYCLPGHDSATKQTHLRFGDDAVVLKTDAKRTPFLKATRKNDALKLIGISVAGKRLEIPIRSFDSGCIIDTGAPFSILEEQAYRAVLDAISGYFGRFKCVKKIVNKKYPKNLCYKYPRGFCYFPGIVWHFEGANLEVSGTSLFLFGRNLFMSRFACLQLLGGPETNVLGVYQQQNVRFLYDLGNMRVLFGKEDCSRHGA
ncbi:aspartic proteinase cdr1 [Phtheirospermum japonicum]|uniref:Aspartic proteinase cdr1 n=1 Tax=Phtheirospermum japonicum TaxID=374723 RepID=A0A830CSM0_9LAMI|nr:aspartic proteinase cdr1 [Phtheirospermum japonicum]